MAVLLLTTLLAWIGAAVLVLSEGRLGFAAGLATVGLGLALGLWAQGDHAAAAALVAGAAVAAVLTLRNASTGWGLLPPGSTPRLMLCAACLVVGVAGASLFAGPALPARAAAITVVLLCGARLMGGPEGGSGLALASALTLGLGALGGGEAAVLGALAATGLSAIAAGPWFAPPSQPGQARNMAALGGLAAGAAGLALAAAVVWSPSSLAALTHLAAPRSARALLVAGALSLGLQRFAAGPVPAARGRDLAVRAGVALGVLAAAVLVPQVAATAVLLVFLAGLSAVWPAGVWSPSLPNPMREFRSGSLQGPVLAALLLGLGGLLAQAGSASPLSRAGAVALALGLAAAAGVVPYHRQRLEADDPAGGASLVWTSLFGPVLAAAATTRLMPSLGREQAVFQGALVALGLANLAWGVLGAWRAELAVAWRCSFLADWGLVLVGLGLPGPGSAAAYLLLLSIMVVRLPLYACAGPVLAGREPARGGPRSVVAAAVLGGVAPFGGFPARAFILEAATRVAWPLALALAAAMLLWLLHAYRLGSSVGRTGPRAVVSAALPTLASLLMGVLPGLWLAFGGH